MLEFLYVCVAGVRAPVLGGAGVRVVVAHRAPLRVAQAAPAHLRAEPRSRLPPPLEAERAHRAPVLRGDDVVVYFLDLIIHTLDATRFLPGGTFLIFFSYKSRLGHPATILEGGHWWMRGCEVNVVSSAFCNITMRQ